MVEKSLWSANVLFMERDWMPTITSSRADAVYALTGLNTTIRRIDMLCKLKEFLPRRPHQTNDASN